MSDFMGALGDFVSTGIGDVMNTYQEVLTADTSITPPDAPGVTYESSMTEIQPDVGGVALTGTDPSPTDRIGGIEMEYGS